MRSHTFQQGLHSGGRTCVDEVGSNYGRIGGDKINKRMTDVYKTYEPFNKLDFRKKLRAKGYAVFGSFCVL